MSSPKPSKFLSVDLVCVLDKFLIDLTISRFRGERNFHIFYYMYDGLEADGRLSEFHLDLNLRKNHRFLTDHCQTSQTHIDKFQQLKAGFKLLGFQDGEVDTVYRILAAILHLGDIEFGEVASEDNTDNKSHVIHVEPLRTGENVVLPFPPRFFFSKLFFCMQIEFLESDKIEGSRNSGH